RPCAVAVACRPILGGPETWAAEARDISQGGVALVLRRRFEPGTLLLLGVGDAGEDRALLARVAYAVAADPAGWRLGCAFRRELSAELLAAFGAEPARPAGLDRRAWVRFPCALQAICTAA